MIISDGRRVIISDGKRLIISDGKRLIISDGRRVIISDGIPGCILLYHVLNLICSKIICNMQKV